VTPGDDEGWHAAANNARPAMAMEQRRWVRTI
jgi:hypothetical protein